MTQTSYVLNYWNIPGRGESIRVLLALGGIRFENIATAAAQCVPRAQFAENGAFESQYAGGCKYL